jgi:GNAT superfamily N-acetyltransferase
LAIEIRNASEQDKERCAELLGELSAATGSEVGVDLAHSFEELLTTARGQIVVAEEDSVLLGMATVSYNLAMRYGGEYCQLEELILTPESRGKKLGGLLLQRVIDNATERGCAEMGLYLLETTEHNRPFYAKYGFEVIGTEMRQRLNP